MSQFGNINLKKLFKTDKVHHDNILFKLHHQVNFIVILFGVVFIFGENYLNGKAITCMGGDKYANQYCWLHGTGHLHKWVAEDVTGQCSMDQEEVTKENDRETHYYLWLPFLLAVCMGLVKLPRVVWKNICEREIMSSLVNSGTAEKITARFKKLQTRSVTVWYHVCFAACELLNIVMVLICFHIMNILLNGKFWSYGINVSNYYNSLSNEQLTANPDLKQPNPMCNLFPTEVACKYCTGSIGGGCNDVSSIICILSNNLFNQYYFLILWFWWVVLLFISMFGLLYRVAQMTVPAFSKLVFQSYLTPYGIEYKSSDLSFKTGDYFLLGRLSINVKGSTMEELVNELMYKHETKEEA